MRDSLHAIRGFENHQPLIPASSTISPSTAARSESEPISATVVDDAGGVMHSQTGLQTAPRISEEAGTSNMPSGDESSSFAGESSTDRAEAYPIGGESLPARARGKWGAPQQPFIAAGRASASQETAAQLMSHDHAPAAAPAEVDAEAHSAPQQAQSRQPEVTTAEQQATTPAGSAELHQSASEEAAAVQAFAPADNPPIGPLQPQPEQAQQAEATAAVAGDKKPAVQQAAGSYRRVAWAPLLDSSQHAGATTAAPAGLVPSPDSCVTEHTPDHKLEQVSLETNAEHSSQSVNRSAPLPEAETPQDIGVAQGMSVPQLSCCHCCAIMAQKLSIADLGKGVINDAELPAAMCLPPLKLQYARHYISASA